MLNGGVIAEALATTLSQVQSLRVHAYAADSFLPPGVVVGQPDIALDGVPRTFCSVQWDFPCYLVVERITDVKSQRDLFNHIDSIFQVIENDPSLGGVVQQATALDARPQSVNVNGQDLPGYRINVQVLA